MAILKRVSNLISKTKKRIKNSLVYKNTKQHNELKDMSEEIEKIKNEKIVMERKYIDELSIKQYEIRYITLQMARVTKYINSIRFKSDTNEEIREHLIELIKGNTMY